MSKNYCPKCNKTVEVELIEKKEAYSVREENISINATVMKCGKCGKEIFDTELDSKNLELLYTGYRKKHELLKPSEIKQIRERYGLSQRAFSRLLDWGEITINRYENGSIQDKAHNEVLEFVQKPENLSFIFKKNKHFLTNIERESLGGRLREMLSENSELDLVASLEKYLMSADSVSEYTGFKKFDLEKMKELILYISNSLDGVLKTKNNKLLWYADFLYFKVFSVSISGSTYSHLQYGPIPDNYDDIVNLMIHQKLLRKEEMEFDRSRDIVGENLIAMKKPDLKFFSKDELKIMDYVIEKFRSYSAGKISALSHEELAYKATSLQQTISYSLAKDISLEYSA